MVGDTALFFGGALTQTEPTPLRQAAGEDEVKALCRLHSSSEPDVRELKGNEVGKLPEQSPPRGTKLLRGTQLRNPTNSSDTAQPGFTPRRVELGQFCAQTQ